MNPRIAAVSRAYADGLTTAQVAAQLGLTRKTVRRYATDARAAGIPTPRPNLKRHREQHMQEIARLYRAQWTPDGIAAKLGLAVRTVVSYATILRQRGEDIPRAPQTGGNEPKIPVGECCRLHAEGWTQQRLADRYGVSQKGVSACLRRAAKSGIPTGPLGRWTKRAKA